MGSSSAFAEWDLPIVAPGGPLYPLAGQSFAL
jgi:hypothetical protein